jgi:hypothetical protein
MVRLACIAHLWATMEIVEALVRACKLYLAIGIVASAINAVAIHPPLGDSSVERAVAVVQDVMLWPHFLVDAATAVDGRLAKLPREDRPFLYSLLRGGADTR